MIEITFNGAAGCTTGSFHVLRTGGLTLSLDCGLFQGRRSESRRLNEGFPFPPRALDMVLLSHAHIDHSGRLPGLVKGGFHGPIYATPATRDLCSIMLPDSAHIQEEDARFWNEKRSGGRDFIKPLYTVEDAAAAQALFRSRDYGDTSAVHEKVKATFLDAGHILGSAMILLEVADKRRPTRILYSGDMGRFGLPILNDPTEPLPECDWLITECTYADRRHDNPSDMKDRLGRIIGDTCRAGGKVIIPSFSVGRTQEIIYFLMELFEEGRLPEIPVFVDSPLSTGATEVFARHPECYDVQALNRWKRRDDLFGRGGAVSYITSVDESKALNSRGGPCVILSASGMCEAGRILHHLKNNVEDPRNAVIVVGFMAQHTLGRRLVERREEIKIFGRMYRLLARVEILNGFSAHADVTEFRRLYAPLAPRLRGAIVVHGEDQQPPAMKALLEEMGCPNVVIPTMGQTLRLEV